MGSPLLVFCSGPTTFKLRRESPPTLCNAREPRACFRGGTCRRQLLKVYRAVPAISRRRRDHHLRFPRWTHCPTAAKRIKRFGGSHYCTIVCARKPADSLIGLSNCLCRELLEANV